MLRLSSRFLLGTALGYGTVQVDPLVMVPVIVGCSAWMLYQLYGLFPGACFVCGSKEFATLPAPLLCEQGPARAWWDLRPPPRLRRWVCAEHLQLYLRLEARCH